MKEYPVQLSISVDLSVTAASEASARARAEKWVESARFKLDTFETEHASCVGAFVDDISVDADGATDT